MKVVAVILFLIFLSNASFAKNFIEEKAEIARSVWEYDRNTFIQKTSLSGYRIKPLDVALTEESAEASFLLALNCHQPSVNSRYYVLYRYRCKSHDTYDLLLSARYDLYSLIAVLPKHKDLALNYINAYYSFVLNVETQGFPEDAAHKEWIAEIQKFILEGGYPYARNEKIE